MTYILLFECLCEPKNVAAHWVLTLSFLEGTWSAPSEAMNVQGLEMLAQMALSCQGP